jgi:RluA family pseudouridine synthase
MVPILFENDDIIGVDKPPGIASIPERQETAPNVLAQLSARSQHKIYVVHRLDKDASGVILFAKNALTHKYLSQQFTRRSVKKTYLALVHGVIADRRGVIDKPLRQFASGRVAVDSERGKPCVTEFAVAQRFDSYTLVRAYPLTGRLHQLRVHFYSIGHPIVGDRLYGPRHGLTPATTRTNTEISVPQCISPCPSVLKRLMLHAEKITFELPSGEDLTIESPIPDSFAQLIKSLSDRR